MSLKELAKTRFFRIVESDEYEFILAGKTIAVLPFIYETGEVILREEYLPCWTYQTGKEYHLTCVTGMVEEGEDAQAACLRELEEETGIVPDEYDYLVGNDLFTGKGSNRQVTPIILVIKSIRSESEPKGDGSKFEAKAKVVRYKVEDFENVESCDILTELLLNSLSLLIMNSDSE